MLKKKNKYGLLPVPERKLFFAGIHPKIAHPNLGGRFYKVFFTVKNRSPNFINALKFY
jgi:hypothetical protein